MTARKIAIFALALLCVLLPICLLLFSAGDDGLPHDFGEFSYFAITDAQGQEAVYAPADGEFTAARAAFLAATPTEAFSYDKARAITLDWIKDGRAWRYDLVITPSPLSAILFDRDGHAYALPAPHAYAFAALPAASHLLVGEMPPAVSIAGRSLSPSLVEWRYRLTIDGEERTLSSGNREFTAVAPAPISSADFSVSFATPPTLTEYSLFLGDTLLSSSTTPPNFDGLGAGSYQLVLVATFEDGTATTRAAYSAFISVA